MHKYPVWQLGQDGVTFGSCDPGYQKT